MSTKKRQRHILFFLCIQVVALLLTLNVCCQQASADNLSLSAIRDSLNSIQYIIPSIPKLDKWKVITISDQTSWENLDEILKTELERGERNIELRVKGKDLILPATAKSIMNLNYPEANIRIVGKNARMISEGKRFSISDDKVYENSLFWMTPFNEFNIDDIISDENGDVIPLRTEMKFVEGQINEVKEVGDDVWQMKTDLPDMSEDLCKDFFILLTRDWTSARHKVLKVNKGQLYFHLDSDDYHDKRNPNIDYLQYKVRPRYCLINCPVSDGIHVTNGVLYIPLRYKNIRINKGGILLHVLGCKFNSLEVTGFNLNCIGNNSPIGVYQCDFITGMFIHHNIFTNLSSFAICTGWCTNVIVKDNTIHNTRTQAIQCGGTNTTITHNILKNVGWMQNTPAITGSGDKLHICDNIIEDFHYSAISCGSRSATRDSVILTYIIERNTIRLTEEFSKNYMSNTLADGGGIYIAPSCTQGIIRNNVISGMSGINSNRGIFLDDGAKNLAIYGNLIINTANSYDIDLRYCRTFKSDIPDHNTNNSIFNNVLTGGYRFEDAGSNSHCVGGQNILLKTGPYQEKNVKLNQQVEDIELVGCYAKKGIVIVPKNYKSIFENLLNDAIVRDYFYFVK